MTRFATSEMAVIVVLTAVGCVGSSQPPLQPNPGEDCMGGVVLAIPRLVEIAVDDSVLVTAKRLSFTRHCFPNAGTSFEWQSQQPDLVRITRLGDSVAYLTGLGVGNFLVYATLEGGDVPGPLSAKVRMIVR